MNEVAFMRHILATLAYRAAKTMRGAPDNFAVFRAMGVANSPARIVAHMGDLMDWSLTLLKGESKWHDSEPMEWKRECERFFAALKRFDDALASGESYPGDLSMIFQGPISDALTHTGQLAMLRRLSGSPMKGEAYTRAEIKIGNVGFEQTPANPKYEFD